MAEHLQQALVAAIVLAALLFLVGHFSGATARFLRRRKPDVAASKLVRKKRQPGEDPRDA